MIDYIAAQDKSCNQQSDGVYQCTGGIDVVVDQHSIGRVYIII